MTTGVKIEGLDELVRALDSAKIHALVVPHLNRAGMIIEQSAKAKAPVDVGRLRTSITHVTSDEGGNVQVAIGSNLFYAPYMEYGTGAQGDPDAPYAHKASHWPPGEALGLWAARHGGASGFAIAAAIGKRGGLEPRRYLRNALDEFRPRMGELVAAIKASIAAAFE
jgi:hypothetical protein